jgi:hypothetical protein
MANGGNGFAEPPAGDHLQSVYRFWLVRRQLGDGAAPWEDPYSFQPLVEPQTVLGGWPYGLPFWPLDAAFGPVVAWNVLLLGTVVAAGLLTYSWLRELGLPSSPAALGGLAFAIAPYRLEQSAGHLLGWAALFVPLALFALERARRTQGMRAHGWGALAAGATVSIPLSGQVHLALGAVPLVVAYAFLRSGRVPIGWALAGAIASAGIGLAIRYTLIAGSSEAGGRSTEELRRYSAEPIDFLNRWHEPASEEFVYVGWVTPALALVGVVVLLRGRRKLGVFLGLAALIPVVFALGVNLPGYEALWRTLPALHFTRVPGRLLPLAVLALAALAAFGSAAILVRARRRWFAVAGGLLLLVALDLLAQPLVSSAADPDNGAYRALADMPPGRVLQLPLFGPGQHYASTYDYYQLQEAREHPSGYSTLAPERVEDFYFDFNRLSCGVWLPGDAAALERLGVTAVTLHQGLYGQAHRRGSWFAWKGLLGADWGPLATDGAVTLFRPAATAAQEGPPIPEPPRGSPVLCTGWRGRTALTRQTTLWVHGGGSLDIDVRVSDAEQIALLVDGKLAGRRVFATSGVLRADLGDPGWHALLLEASRAGYELVRVGPTPSP